MKRGIVVATAFLICTGIGIPAKAEMKAAQPSVPYGILYNKIQFENVSAADIPDSLSGRIASNKERQGFLHYYDEDTGYMYIAVLMGKKNTGGYSVEVTDVEDVEGRTNVWIKESKPMPGYAVIQAITYPYTVIRAKGITPNITIKNSSGTVYDNLNYAFDDDINTDELKDTKFNNLDEKDNVEESRIWSIFFSREISPEDVNDSTIYVRNSNGQRVKVSLELMDDKKQVIVKPDANYKTKGSYYLFIKKSASVMPLNIGDMKGYRMKFVIK